jgi:hypothetical protein
MPIVRIDNHWEQAQELLLEQYKRAPRFLAWLKSYVDRVQTLENAIWDVIVSRIVETAVGVQLDAIGNLVVEPRNGKSDEVYRLYVLARIRLNWSNGKAVDIIEVLRIVEAAGFRYLEYPPASIDVEYTSPPAASGIDLAAIAQQARATPIRLGVVISPEPYSGSIIGSYDESIPSTTQGGADEAETVGGVGAHVFE